MHGLKKFESFLNHLGDDELFNKNSTRTPDFLNHLGDDELELS
ncbi:hypothetical protein ACVSZY_001748 [Acinetobacter baumannii]